MASRHVVSAGESSALGNRTEVLENLLSARSYMVIRILAANPELFRMEVIHESTSRVY
jgi:hypothetical protein